MKWEAFSSRSRRQGLHLTPPWRAQTKKTPTGLAGNFAFERGHHEISTTIGELGVLPAARKAAPMDLVIADGFSCRTQIEQGGTGRGALHLAEVLALGLDGPLPATYPEHIADRPRVSARDARLADVAAVAVLGALASAPARHSAGGVHEAGSRSV